MIVTKIFGAPGTGKTLTLEKIIEKELKDTPPNRIACCTFTKKGADEILMRVCSRFNLDRKDFLFFRTIHSLCFTQLNLKITDVIDKQDYKNLSKALSMNFLGYYTDELKNDDDAYLFYSQLKSNNFKQSEKMLSFIDPYLAFWVERNYKKYKDTVSKLDFTDILYEFLKKGVELDIDVGFIDEAQDLTTLQWLVVKKMFKKCKKLFIAGDDDQAIYEWSGADINYFLNYKANDNIILDYSYRLPSNIHTYALKIADRICNRQIKQYKPKKLGGTVNIVEDINEISIDKNKSYYFLARNNQHLKSVKKYLYNKGLIFTDKQGLSINKYIIKAIDSYTKKINGEPITKEDQTNYEQFIDNKKTTYKYWYDAFTKIKPDIIDYYRDIIKNKTSLSNCNIVLSTIHGVKGGEADNVVLLLDYTKEVDKNMLINQDSEYRCYYVACTRAKDNLYLVKKTSQLGYSVLK